MSIDWNTINNDLSSAICENDRLGDLLTDLGCEFKTRDQRSYRGPCPVHDGGGDNCVVDTFGDTIPIRWQCFSYQCHEKFKPSLLGLVRGVISTQSGEKVPMQAAVKFIERYVQIASSEHGYPSIVGQVRQPRLRKTLNLTRARVRQQLAIPSEYFLSRGFSREVLDAFDVGYSHKLKRSVVRSEERRVGK